MGGKHKQPQRTKNNARPSNSGRSAELLSSSINPLFGFQSVKDSASVLTGFGRAASSNDDVEINIDANFQLVLKKMNKKDSKTKLKALQEFTELVENSQPEAVKAVLPFWSRLYAILAVDVEHKVREGTHNAHRAVVNKVKRNLAPYLKQLAGPWFTSQYDTYAPAASAAVQSFQDAFPPSKVQEAIVFCQDEILSYIGESVTVQTPATLARAKAMSTEEAETKYERLLLASLHGYILYLNMLSKEQILSAEKLNTDIISNAKFWRLSKNKIAAVRTAFFSCVAALCENAPYLVGGELSRMAGIVFSSLDDAEPAVLHATWHAALVIVSNIADWSQYVNIERLVCPQLWRILREGGQGAAVTIFPNLLPFISHLPTTLDHNNFYGHFFQNIISGMKKRQVVQSRSEFGTIATTFMECLRYVIMKNALDIEFGKTLIISYLVPTIEWSFLQQSTSVKQLFQELSVLLYYWQRNECASYEQLLACFWTCLKEAMRSTLTSCSGEPTRLMFVADKQVELVVCVKRARTYRSKKQATVTFAEHAHVNEQEQHEYETSAPVDEAPLPQLSQLAHDMVALYLHLVQQKGCAQLILSLCFLVEHFDSADLFRHIYANFKDTYKNNSFAFVLHKHLLSNFLTVESTRSKSIVDLVFVFYKYMESDDKAVLLDSFTKLKNEDCLCWCVAKALSYPYCNDPTIKAWLSTTPITKLLVRIASAMLTEEISAERSLLLKQALNQTVNGDLYISEEACKEIISILCNTLLHPSEYPDTIDLCASFSAELAATLYTEKTHLTYGDQLILALFSLSCNTKYDADTISADTIWEVNTAWQDAVGLLLAEHLFAEFDELLLKFRHIVHSEFVEECNHNSLDRLVAVSVSLLRSLVHESDTARVNRALQVILTMPADIEHMRAQLSDICASTLMLRGHISWLHHCPLPEDIFSMQCSDGAILNYLHWQRFVINILSRLFQQNAETRLILTTDNISDFVISALYSYALIRIFMTHFKTTKLYSDIIEILDDVSEEYEHFITNVACADIIMKVKHPSMELLYIFYADLLVNECDMVDMYRNLATQNNSSINTTQLTQIFSKHLKFVNVCKIKEAVDVLIVTRAFVGCEDIDTQIAEAFGISMRIREMGTTMLVDHTDLCNCTWTQIQTVIEMVRYVTAVIEKSAAILLPAYQDFIMISLASWLVTAHKNKQRYDNIAILQFVCAVCELYMTFQNFIKNDSTCSKLACEYHDVFEEEMNICLVDIWTFIAERELEKQQVSIPKLAALNVIGNVMLKLEPKYVVSSSSIVQLCGELLQSGTTTLQLWGYYGLHQVLTELVQLDAQCEDTHGMLVHQLGPVLTTMQDVVLIMLMEFRIGEDSCRVQPFTDSYRFTFGYLLLWDILFSLCQCAPAPLRYQYSEWLRDQDYLNKLLNNIFKLMPTEVLHCSEGKKTGLTELFTVKPSFQLSQPATSEHLEHLVCWLYGKVLSTLPALVRQWWTDTEQKTAQMVEQVTAAYVSPMVCTQELRDVADKDKNTSNNMKVKVHASVREVVATYIVDEARMELMVTLPANYPLGAVQVSCNKQIGGSALCRNWLMQLTIFLTHQNGRIWEALSVWKSSLDKKFDGVEECYICFSVLHHTTCQLPKLSCQTCKKKFHTTCLYKWFSTSNKSTCPICRNLF